jgi:hypothetical protein
MEKGNLIAVNGNLYEYGEVVGKVHRVYAIDIDDQGKLTHTYSAWFFTDEELTEGNKPNFTEEQWIGIVETLLRNDYDLTEEEIETAAEDIVCREFAILGVPTVEELNHIIETYMNR